MSLSDGQQAGPFRKGGIYESYSHIQRKELPFFCKEGRGRLLIKRINKKKEIYRYQS
jgi:hypothetical protein